MTIKIRSHFDAGYKKGCSIYSLSVHANSISIFHLLGLEHLRKKRDARKKPAPNPSSKCSASVNLLHSLHLQCGGGKLLYVCV